MAAGLGLGVARWGRGTSPAVCLRASIYDNQESNSVNHPELPSDKAPAAPRLARTAGSDSGRDCLLSGRSWRRGPGFLEPCLPSCAGSPQAGPGDEGILSVL